MTANKVTALLQEARSAHTRRDWTTAHTDFNAVRERVMLTGDDLVSLAGSAWWLGNVDESIAVFEEAYRYYLHESQPRPAAVAALSIGYTLAIRGEYALASGWMSRAYRLLNTEPACVEQGYLRYYEFETALDHFDEATALDKARDVQAFGRRFSDPTLMALGILAEGRALVRLGDVRRGMELLDEAMLAALTDDLQPSWSGNIYCHLMITCYEIVDIGRAAEWTDAIGRFWARFSAAGPFLGICRAHRAHVLQMQGAWEQAEREASQVCSTMAHFAINGVAEAHYQLGEIARLRGDFSGAEAAYGRAHECGRDPQPGFALMRLAQGRVETALASIQTSYAAHKNDRLARARRCGALVEIALAAGAVDLARDAANELHETASIYQSGGLTAAAKRARGAILLAEGQPDEALAVLHNACRCWRRLSTPYETARTRLLLARAYEQLDDRDAAERERAAALDLMTRLGLSLDETPSEERSETPDRPDGLTEREIGVLRLVAAGKTNRTIADELFISQKTVARHLANIFTKLDLSSRTAAAAYAIEHGLTERERGSFAP